MDWTRAAQSTFIGIEAYKTAVGNQPSWSVIDTLKLVREMQTGIARLAWLSRPFPADHRVLIQDWQQSRRLQLDREGRQARR
jgi:hypothetical protein